MDFQKELSSERLPRPDVSEVQDDGSLAIPLSDVKHMSEEELAEKLEVVLLERIQNGDNLAIFQLGQLYFEQEDYTKAVKYFEQGSEKGDVQSMFQLSVILYDGLAGHQDQDRGFKLMKQVSESTSKMARHLKYAAHYNLGRAYFQGCGVKQSDDQAEMHWQIAADDGNPSASVKAQSTLGLFYAAEDFKDLKKSFFWHSEACGNGSLESQGAMGVMYQNGLGCKKDMNSAFICLREAAERGNVYAMGHLIAYYYRRKLYTKTVELAARVSQFEDPPQIGKETDCLPSYVAKGIAMASFYYARCLHMGFGVKKTEDLAKQFYSKCYQYDANVCAQLQAITQKGQI